MYNYTSLMKFVEYFCGFHAVRRPDYDLIYEQVMDVVRVNQAKMNTEIAKAITGPYDIQVKMQHEYLKLDTCNDILIQMLEINHENTCKTRVVEFYAYMKKALTDILNEHMKETITEVLNDYTDFEDTGDIDTGLDYFDELLTEFDYIFMIPTANVYFSRIASVLVEYVSDSSRADMYYEIVEILNLYDKDIKCGRSKDENNTYIGAMEHILRHIRKHELFKLAEWQHSKLTNWEECSYYTLHYLNPDKLIESIRGEIPFAVGIDIL